MYFISVFCSVIFQDKKATRSLETIHSTYRRQHQRLHNNANFLHNNDFYDKNNDYDDDSSDDNTDDVCDDDEEEEYDNW